MNAPTRTPANTAAPSSGSSKTLWAAMLVLVVVVLAMGAALIRIQSRPIEPRMAVLPKSGQALVAPTARTTQPKNKAEAPMNKASPAMDNAAASAPVITAKPRPVLPREPEPAVLRPPAPGASTTANPESHQALPR